MKLRVNCRDPCPCKRKPFSLWPLRALWWIFRGSFRILALMGCWPALLLRPFGAKSTAESPAP
jgi:hypothetical protein